MTRKLGLFVVPILAALVLVPAPAALAAGTSSAAPAVCTSWVMMASRNPGSADNDLNSVAVVSASNVWAVGDYVAGATTKTLVAHWNGKTWKVVRSPNKGTDDTLHSVYAVSPTSTWAVGSATTTAPLSVLSSCFGTGDAGGWSQAPTSPAGPTSCARCGRCRRPRPGRSAATTRRAAAPSRSPCT